ncbi:MAG: hypothetical protein PGN23_12465 [Sphingomonas adhaesiva]|uniref:hypothetical protein n=1 Tax=Sphingomonas adhaesiva TaxID=28212 RepID=UPI002FFAB1DA
MIRTIIGALLGRELGQRQGAGMKGAVTGALLTRAVSRMGPLGMAVGGAYVAKKAYDRRKLEKAGQGTRI